MNFPGYWHAGHQVSRRNEADYKLGIIEMQTIDADCNDCRFFKRGQLHKGVALNWFDGHCLKFDKPTKAYPCWYTGHECFEHRRAAELPQLYEQANCQTA